MKPTLYQGSSITMISTSPRFSAAVVFLIALCLMLFTGVQIARTPRTPVFDQLFIRYTFDQGYPTLASGITSLLMVGLVNQGLGQETGRVDLVQTDSAIRILAAILYLGSSGLLSWALFTRYRVLSTSFFLLLVLTSRYPFLWLSSELFAGSFLMLYLWSMLSNQHFGVRILLLVLFAWSKPDLLVPGVIVGLYEALALTTPPERDGLLQRAIRIVAGLTLFALPALPTLFFNGLAVNTGLSNRSLASFAQHYAALVERHQIGPAPEPWANAFAYLDATFGPVTSVVKAIQAAPSTYMDFIFLSAAKSIRNSMASYTFFLLPLVALLWQAIQPTKLKIIALLLLTNLIPILLLSFVHVRYLARFYPLTLALIFSGLFQAPAQTPTQHRISVAAYGYLILLFIMQLYLALPVFQTGYWFYD
jgi:hypothetical protein